MGGERPASTSPNPNLCPSQTSPSPQGPTAWEGWSPTAPAASMGWRAGVVEPGEEKHMWGQTRAWGAAGGAGEPECLGLLPVQPPGQKAELRGWGGGGRLGQEGGTFVPPRAVRGLHRTHFPDRRPVWRGPGVEISQAAQALLSAASFSPTRADSGAHLSSDPRDLGL